MQVCNTFYTVTCPGLPSPSNGGRTYDMNAVGGRYPVYTVVYFTCNYGYRRDGPQSRTCQNSGNWNMQSPTCTQSNKHNLICFITETIIHLFRTKRYTKFLQIFSTVTCQALSSPSNGGRTYNKNAVGGRYPVDTVVTFTCNSGYSLSGSSTTKCQTSGQWNNNSPTCNRSNKNYIILLNRM